MNAVLDRSAGFITYLRGENIKPYLRILFAVCNFKASLKDKFNRKELPTLNYNHECNKRITCTCALCVVMSEDDVWDSATMDTIGYERIYDASSSISVNDDGDEVIPKEEHGIDMDTE